MRDKCPKCHLVLADRPDDADDIVCLRIDGWECRGRQLSAMTAERDAAAAHAEKAERLLARAQEDMRRRCSREIRRLAELYVRYSAENRSGAIDTCDACDDAVWNVPLKAAEELKPGLA